MLVPSMGGDPEGVAENLEKSRFFVTKSSGSVVI
jgi:hypothetical protein